MEELMARINNQVEIRRQTLPTRVEYKQKEFSLGSFVYNPDRMELRNAEEIIKLSNREAEIMNIFCLHQNTAIDRRELMQMVWGDDSYFISRNLDVYSSAT